MGTLFPLIIHFLFTQCIYFTSLFNTSIGLISGRRFSIRSRDLILLAYPLSFNDKNCNCKCNGSSSHSSKCIPGSTCYNSSISYNSNSNSNNNNNNFCSHITSKEVLFNYSSTRMSCSSCISIRLATSNPQVGLAYCLSSSAISIFLIPAPSPNPFIDLLLLFRRMGLAVSYDHDEVGYWQAHSYHSF